MYEAIRVEASMLKGVLSLTEINLSGTSTVNEVSDTPSGILVSPSIVCSKTTLLDVLLLGQCFVPQDGPNSQFYMSLLLWKIEERILKKNMKLWV